MPIEVMDLDEGSGCIIIGSSVVRDKKYVNALKRHLNQDKEKFKEYKYNLTDYTKVTNIEQVTTGDVQLIANLCIRAVQINPDAIVAIVADREIWD